MGTRGILIPAVCTALGVALAACGSAGSTRVGGPRPGRPPARLSGTSPNGRQAGEGHHAVPVRHAALTRRDREITAAMTRLCDLYPGASPASVRLALASAPSVNWLDISLPGYTPPKPVTGRWAGKLSAYLPTTRRVVALTFDAGANDAGVPSILRTLRRFKVPATFFLTGHFAHTYPSVAREIAGDGFLIGNHTASHTNLTQLTGAEARWEIVSAAREIRTVSGVSPAPLFRFPYGADNARLIAIANRLGFTTLSWTVDTLGWEGTSAGITVREVVSRTLAALRPGEIVLMHVGSSPDGSTLDADALPTVIRDLEARGYSFVTLGSFFG